MVQYHGTTQALQTTVRQNNHKIQIKGCDNFCQDESGSVPVESAEANHGSTTQDDPRGNQTRLCQDNIEACRSTQC